MDTNKLSSEHIEDKMFTLISENLFSKNWFETKLQAKFDKSGQIFEQTE